MWQPIETFVRGWPLDFTFLLTDGHRVVPVQAHDSGYYDLTTWTYDGNDNVDFEPTHWMPLPEPPQ